MDQIPTSMVAHVVVQTKPSSHGMFESMECTVESVKDFLSKLGIKTRMHLVEIRISSLNHVSVRLNKILCFLKMCPIFVSSVHNFGRFDNVMI